MTTIQMGPGRPRHTGSRSSERPAREEILDHAARLFVERGFSGTSTREIAEACGIRQASLYYHFTGKDDILAELLHLSVRPSLDKVEKIEAECAPDIPERTLYLLALIDVNTLTMAPHNIGKLYRMPDVRNSRVFQEFKPALQELNAAYGRLGAEIANEAVAAAISVNQLGGLLIQVVEVVIRIRSGGCDVVTSQAHAIAATCLRVCGVPENRIALAAATAEDVMTVLDATPRSVKTFITNENGTH
ncbi:transcriptional regulator, TetR family [Nocardioides sp. YR527]|uniref:TetR/AcrR family transcriptional regulator n=1 Tax=Nocardioides sp. YR527 TaxID=1881028 RepID=UPI0008911080|nr:TetR/AcrR family transcriptional regulator [Nocardioides sp. YR527]SDK54832.1 transcriptional regulator, TetR family [Nocardioides sp. YR527]